MNGENKLLNDVDEPNKVFAVHSREINYLISLVHSMGNNAPCFKLRNESLLPR